jgi:hypothetical protein
MRKIYPTLLVAALALPGMLGPPAGATIRHVPDPYPTIQAGIDASLAGDTVLVADGVYRENVSFGPDDITVASEYLWDMDPAHIAATQIMAAVFGPPVVRIGMGQTRQAVLCGFTITGGTGIEGSGVFCDGTSPTVEHNHITNNCPQYDGGGIRVNLGSPDIRHNTITGN